MREELAKREGQRGTYFAMVTDQTRAKWFRDHNGTERRTEMRLLLDVRDSSGKQVTDHLWFYSKLFEGFAGGDKVRFVATASPYRKLVRAADSDLRFVATDWKLTRPRDIERVDPETLRSSQTQAGLEAFLR